MTFSSAIGAGYAVIARGSGFDLSTSLVAGGLCGVAGMLPDVDSDSGIPRRETMGFAAAIVPMLLLDRFRQFNLTHDQIVLLAAATYFVVRFKVSALIGRFSVHRGMWHSIPAVLIFAGLAFLGSNSDNVLDRYLKAAAVGLGSLSHLLLDEIYSVDTRGVVPRFKKSFGSAIKFWGKDRWANVSTYAKLFVVMLAILTEPMVIERIEQRNPERAEKLRVAASRLRSPRDWIRSGSDETLAAPPPAITEAPPLPYQPAPQQAPVERPRFDDWFLPPDRPGAVFSPNQNGSR